MDSEEYPVLIFQLAEQDGGGFVATAPDLKGCFADGESREAALADVKKAIEEWIDEAKRLGRPVPKPGDCAVRAQAERGHLEKLIDAQDDLVKRQSDLLKSQDKLLDKQDKLLDKQGKLLRDARADIARIKETLEGLAGSREARHSYDHWGHSTPCAFPAAEGTVVADAISPHRVLQ